VVEGEQHHKLTVRGRTIGWHTVDHHGDGRVCLSVRTAKGENEELVASDPQLVTDAYLLVAPKRLAAQVGAS
jgi:hypothetical protein